MKNQCALCAIADIYMHACMLAVSLPPQNTAVVYTHTHRIHGRSSLKEVTNANRNLFEKFSEKIGLVSSVEDWAKKRAQVSSIQRHVSEKVDLHGTAVCYYMCRHRR